MKIETASIWLMTRGEAYVLDITPQRDLVIQIMGESPTPSSSYFLHCS